MWSDQDRGYFIALSHYFILKLCLILPFSIADILEEHNDFRTKLSNGQPIVNQKVFPALSTHLPNLVFLFISVSKKCCPLRRGITSWRLRRRKWQHTASLHRAPQDRTLCTFPERFMWVCPWFLNTFFDLSGKKLCSTKKHKDSEHRTSILILYSSFSPSPAWSRILPNTGVWRWSTVRGDPWIALCQLRTVEWRRRFRLNSLYYCNHTQAGSSALK